MIFVYQRWHWISQRVYMEISQSVTRVAVLILIRNRHKGVIRKVNKERRLILSTQCHKWLRYNGGCSGLMTLQWFGDITKGPATYTINYPMPEHVLSLIQPFLPAWYLFTREDIWRHRGRDIEISQSEACIAGSKQIWNRHTKDTPSRETKPLYGNQQKCAANSQGAFSTMNDVLINFVSVVKQCLTSLNTLTPYGYRQGFTNMLIQCGGMVASYMWSHREGYRK